MKVTIQLDETSNPIVYVNAKNAYTKGPLYCIMDGDGTTVHKYPVEHLFMVKEEAEQVMSNQPAI